MATIAATRSAIAAALTDAGFRAFDHSPPMLTYPCIIVGLPSRYEFDVMGNGAMFTIPCSVYVAYAANRAAEDNLEALLTTADGSIIDTINSIGGNYSVRSVRDFGVLQSEAGQNVALGCVIEVDVYT